MRAPAGGGGGGLGDGRVTPEVTLNMWSVLITSQPGELLRLEDPCKNSSSISSAHLLLYLLPYELQLEVRGAPGLRLEDDFPGLAEVRRLAVLVDEPGQWTWNSIYRLETL